MSDEVKVKRNGYKAAAVVVIGLASLLIAVYVYASNKLDQSERSKELNFSVTSLLNGGSIDDVEKLVKKYHFTFEELEEPCKQALSNRIYTDGCTDGTKQLAKYCRINNDTYIEAVRSIRAEIRKAEDYYSAELLLFERCQDVLDRPNESVIRLALAQYLDNGQGKAALSVAERYGFKESVEYAAKIYVINLLHHDCNDDKDSCEQDVWDSNARSDLYRSTKPCEERFRECLKTSDENVRIARVIISRYGLDRRGIIDAVALVARGVSINNALLLAGDAAEK